MPQSQQQFPPQHQNRLTGLESLMNPQPIEDDSSYKGSGKLEGKVALITGGDSGIGRAVAILFAKEGATVAIAYLDEHEDAEQTEHMVEKYGGRIISMAGDIGDESFCQLLVNRVMEEYGHIDILVNHAGEQRLVKGIEEISSDQLQHTFQTNTFSMFYLTRAAVPLMKEGSAIINTTSVEAYAALDPGLIDYTASKAAIVGFTRIMAQSLSEKGIRVNAVAPGPVWTPLIPASMPEEKVRTFGADVPMKHAAQPVEIAPSYLFLASRDSSYMTGQVLHPNGGVPVSS